MPKRTNCTWLVEEYLKKDGWLVARTTYYMPFGKVSRDLWGFADSVAIDRSGLIGGTIYIQSTSISNMAARKKKILQNDFAKTILLTGNQIWVVGVELTRKPRKGCEFDGKYIYKFVEMKAEDFGK